MKPICFYHKADLDGVCSAAIVQHFVPDVELYGIDYGEAFPWDRAVPEMKELCDVDQPLGANPELHNLRRVYMVDFSLPVEYMKSLAACSGLVWIDHHQTAISAYEATGPNPFIPGLRRPDLAACELCWNWFGIIQVPDNLQSPVPEAVRLLGIYDSWRKDDPEWQKALDFQYGMRALTGIFSTDCSHSLWQSLFESDALAKRFIKERGLVGQSILNYQAEVNRKACEAGAHEIVLKLPGEPKSQIVRGSNGDDHIIFFGPRFKFNDSGECERVPEEVLPEFKAIACNTIVLNSQFFESVYDPEKHDIMVAYCQMKDGRWKVSLYSTKPEIDCGAIAKAFDGGGHKGAAGFVCDKLPWEA